MHVHCLHWLMSTGLLYQSAFADHVNSQLVKWCKWRAPIWYEDLIRLPLSVHFCLGLVVEYWLFVGTHGRYSHSTLYYLCHLASLFKPLPPPTPPHYPPTHPTPLPSHPPPYIYWPNTIKFL